MEKCGRQKLATMKMRENSLNAVQRKREVRRIDEEIRKQKQRHNAHKKEKTER